MGSPIVQKKDEQLLNFLDGTGQTRITLQAPEMGWEGDSCTFRSQFAVQGSFSETVRSIFWALHTFFPFDLGLERTITAIDDYPSSN